MTEEVKISALGLGSPGPRMMAAAAIARQQPQRLRVLVDQEDAVPDLEAFFSSLGAQTSVEQVGNEFHVVASFSGDAE